MLSVKPKFRFLLTCLLSISILFLIHTSSCTAEKNHQEASQTAFSQSLIPQKIDFNFHVKPILSDRCFTCHGPDETKMEAGLAFYSQEKAFAVLGEKQDHHAIVPGNTDASTLVQRIFSEDPEQQMPPPASNLKLEPHEKEILKKWIEQGAEWKEHWAFTPAEDGETPDVRQQDWVKNAIDNFVLNKLESRELSPSPLARPEKQLRRLSFDLRGLPPSLADIEAFVADPSDKNYESFVDAYLDTDAYAERMTAGWLDLARYADTHGYQDDLERIMWPWRDWVIHAFRQNMRYDQFVTWQLAGDLMPNASREQIIATAFNRNHKITQEGGVISEEYRAEYVTDRTNTFATAFLGLTMECAKCHDHKYDPISQQEYFELFAYFNHVAEKGLIESYGEIPKPYIMISDEEIQETLTFINNLDSAKEVSLLVMEELAEPRQTHILARGQYDKPTVPVSPAVPAFGNKKERQTAKNRLELAQWLFSKDHPLTARVMVNRIWKQLFDKGLVATTFDFGNQGSLPTHPELLDHLALKFQQNDWDIQYLIKYIVTSATYRQASKISPAMLEIDPSNQLLARAPRGRLSAEMIRDHALSISGLLVNEVGGPSVKPYQPSGLWEETTGGGGGSTARYIQDEGPKNYRRSLYTFWKRTVPPPNMMTFDAPSRDLCSVQRTNTNTPLQALVLMNDPQFLEAADALAKRAVEEVGEEPQAVIKYMFAMATSRWPEADELASLEALVGVGRHSEVPLNGVEKAYAFIASTIFNLDETIRKN